jgi:peroxiredoxin
MVIPQKEARVNGTPDDDERATAMPLAERLAAMELDVRTSLHDYTRAMDDLVARLAQSGAGRAAPAIGDTFPDFVLPDTTSHLWQLSRILPDGPVVVAFHRGNWCSFCNLNMASLAGIFPRLRAMGCRLVAITPETADLSGEMAANAGAGFPILCDIGLGVSTMVGLSYVVDDNLRRELERLDVDITGGNANAGWLLPIPATFVLDQAGRVVARHVDPDPRRRMDPAAILHAATVCQSAARN